MCCYCPVPDLSLSFLCLSRSSLMTILTLSCPFSCMSSPHVPLGTMGKSEEEKKLKKEKKEAKAAVPILFFLRCTICTLLSTVYHLLSALVSLRPFKMSPAKFLTLI